jgi:hypothetical protein
MLMSNKDDFIKNKYYNFIKQNHIEIVSDIFERMERDRKEHDKLIKLIKNSERHGVEFDLKEYLKEKK